MIDEVWNKSSIVMDHWKSLRLTEITSQFALPDDMDLLQNFLTRKSPDSRESFCDTIAEECHDGLYYPLNHHCNRLSGKCAILISSTPGSQASFFPETNLGESRAFYEIQMLTSS